MAENKNLSTNQKKLIDEALRELESLSNKGKQSINPIIEYLSNDIWDVRKKASECLIQFGEDVVPYITSNLKSHYFQDEDLLYWSIQTLGGLGKDTSVNILLEWLEDPSFPKNYRVFIVKALEKNKSNKAIKPLIESLCDESYDVQFEAAEVLKNYGKKVIPHLQTAFSSDKVEIRTWVSRILGQLLGKDAMTFFKNMLASEKRELRYYAVSALEEIGDMESLDLILSKLCDPSFLVRVQVADILKRKGEMIIPSLLSILRNGDTNEKYHAARVIYSVMGGASVQILKDRIGVDDLESKLLILSAIAETGGGEVVHYLAESFYDQNWLVQKHGANLLNQIGQSVIDPVTKLALKTDNDEVKMWLIIVLSHFKDKSIESYKQLFEKARRKEKIWMLKSLEESDNIRVMYFLIRALIDINWSVRNQAFDMLKKFKERTIIYDDKDTYLGNILVEIKSKGLEDENPVVRKLIDAANKLDVYRRRASDKDGNPKQGHEKIIGNEIEKISNEKTFKSILFHNHGTPYQITIDDLLIKAMESGASDIHISAGYPPVFRIRGGMIKQDLQILTADNTKFLTCSVISEPLRNEFETHKELDVSYEISGVSRFRLNIFQEVSGIGLVFRIIPTKIPEIEEIMAPPILEELCKRKKGLILVTGPTGSGKSTTLAAMISKINHSRKEHIITIEDPVEFIHKPVLSKITQREVKVSTHSFAGALRSALREDPNIILVGEMRDLETIELAIVAAETGHLVFGTVHTSSASSTIDRIIDAFPSGKHEQIRVALVEGLVGIVAQTLIPKADGHGQVAAFEVMTMTSAIGNLIREGKTIQIRDYILQGKKQGMILLDDALAKLIQEKLITYEDALYACYDKDSFKKKFAGAGNYGDRKKTLSNYSDPLDAPMDGLPPKRPFKS